MPVYFMVGTLYNYGLSDKTDKIWSIYLCKVGGNEEAARASGINVEKIKILAYVANGVLVGLAAVVWVAPCKWSNAKWWIEL